MHAYIHIYIHTYICIRTCTYMHTYIHTYIHTYMYASYFDIKANSQSQITTIKLDCMRFIFHKINNPKRF